MYRYRRPALLVATTLALAAGSAAAQGVERVGAGLLQEVMPEADRFDEADGDPPMKRAYHGQELIGYVLLTSDLPPEEVGYSGPITALVGVTTDGIVTGVRVTAYRESRRYDSGDFLEVPAFLERFVGLPVGGRFSVGQTIDGMSGVTISVRAMTRGIRDAARRVVLAYSAPAEESPEALSEAEVASLSWYEMRRRGLVATMWVRQARRAPIVVSLIHMSSEELGRHLVGERYEPLVERIEEAGGADEVVLYVVEGGGFVSSLRTGWSIEQGGRAVAIPRERVVSIGRPSGALSGESSQVGALLLSGDELDVAEPLTVAFDRGRPDLGTFRVDYTSRAAFVRMAEATRPVESELLVEASIPSEVDVAPAVPAPSSPDSAALAEDTLSAPVAPSLVPAVVEQAQPMPVAAAEDDRPDRGTIWAAWPRVGWTVLAIVLAGLAFFTKNTALRWISLAVTMVALGWIDGGFLSISHVTGLVWVGFSAIRSDPALILLSAVTVVSVLLWGRVFCGYLCPFGALQDFIDRFVPRRFKRELPQGVHRVAWKAKYLILALILGAALVGVQASLFQYFEPFGTVFSLSPSVLLWTIAGGILAASAVVPRFYCRYMCPLGALLAIGSVLSIRRIPRVEQCDHCHVCEQKCPTRAIRGPKIDFAECVRCNICEVQLLQRRGVCQHDMEDVRPRLVQLRLGSATASAVPRERAPA